MARLLTLGMVVLSLTSSAVAQDVTETEGIDPTRLDVERLPPEAIEVSRDQYATGFVVEGWIGGRGFVGNLGELISAGPYANVGLGYELFRWLSVRLALEASFHETSAPAPPSPTTTELVGALLEVRLQLGLTPSLALWAQGEVGGLFALGDVLRVYGLDQSGDVGFQFGGSGGFDYHFHSRHMSIGIAGGVRAYPSLAGAAESVAVGIHGALYLRHVM